MGALGPMGRPANGGPYSPKTRPTHGFPWVGLTPEDPAHGAHSTAYIELIKPLGGAPGQLSRLYKRPAVKKVEQRTMSVFISLLFLLEFPVSRP
jgi:hypothetical protein